jgi:hypothetical protein
MTTVNKIKTLNDANIGGKIKLSDISEPSNTTDGNGLLYKKISDDGIFWKPDSVGLEVDLTRYNIAGTQFQTDEDTTTSSTTISLFYQLRHRFTTTSLPQGTYRIAFLTLHNATKNNAAPRVQIQVTDGTGTTTLFGGGYFAAEVKDPNPDRFEHYYGADFYTGSGVFDIDINYRRIGGGGGTPAIVSITYSRITIWRIS